VPVHRYPVCIAFMSASKCFCELLSGMRERSVSTHNCFACSHFRRHRTLPVMLETTNSRLRTPSVSGSLWTRQTMLKAGMRGEIRSTRHHTPNTPNTVHPTTQIPRRKLAWTHRRVERAPPQQKTYTAQYVHYLPASDHRHPRL
jgi:hypothetical protein